MLTVLVGFGQLVVYGIQARRLRETIDKMDSIAKDQGKDMKAYIAEATRSATSMEGIAAALAANVRQLEETLKISRQISDTNVRIADTNAYALVSGQRAYLNVTEVQFANFGKTAPPILLIQFENSGHAPAALQAWASVLVFGEPLGDVPDALVWNNHSGVAAPGKAITMEKALTGENKTFTADRWKAIETGQLSVAVYGAIRYEAGFGVIGETDYGFIYEPNLTKIKEPHRRFALTKLPGYNRSQ